MNYCVLSAMCVVIVVLFGMCLVIVVLFGAVEGVTLVVN
jgi:hypothetical protein